MDYTRIYNQIVERAQTRKLEGYVEKHHIVPKCIGGLDVKENIVELTAREHFLCHMLLCEIYPQEIKDKMSLIYYQRDKDTLEKTKQAISLAKSSPVLQYSIDGEFIQEWPSIKQSYTTYKGDISACCQGKQKTAAGFVWKYKHK
jgi:hypothetical protein